MNDRLSKRRQFKYSKKKDYGKVSQNGDLPQGQRPKKSELSGWQLSTRKNFPDEVRKSFSQKNV